jgi:DNA-binding SARP family transcriptional activator
MCAYAAIVDGNCMRSCFALHPDADDIARLSEEFRTLARDLVGPAADGFFDRIGPPAADDHRIEINIFRGTALRAGRQITLTDGEFSVVAVMAMNRQGHSSDEWCDKLWPERDVQSAVRLLRVYIHRLRAKFGSDRIIDKDGNGYRLGRDVCVDLHTLEAMAREHYAGTLRLEEAQLRTVQRAFDGFKERRYRRLAGLERYGELERRLIATGVELARMLVHDAFSQEDGPRALGIAEHLVTLDPYDDVAAELLMRAQVRLGRYDAAQRHFRTFCRTMRDELGLAPPHHLSRLLQQN